MITVSYEPNNLHVVFDKKFKNCIKKFYKCKIIWYNWLLEFNRALLQQAMSLQSTTDNMTKDLLEYPSEALNRRPPSGTIMLYDLY